MANQPVLFYGIRAMAEAGIDEVGIIVAPETGDEIRAAAGDGSQFGVSITYIDQAEPLGLAHAVLTAEAFLGDSAFVMYLGDNLLRNGITELVHTFETDAPDALILLTKVPDPENYGVAELADDGRVSRLVEKPAEPATDLALVGVYMFTAGSVRGRARDRAFRPRRAGDHRRDPAPGGQRQARGPARGPGLVEGHRPGGRHARGQPADPGRHGRAPGRRDHGLARSRAAWWSSAGAVLERATVRGPAVIGAGAVVRDAYIGPYTAIGEDVTIEHAELEHSIVLSGSTIRDLDARIEASLIGKNAVVARAPHVPKAHRFVIGDNSEVQII